MKLHALQHLGVEQAGEAEDPERVVDGDPVQEDAVLVRPAAPNMEPPRPAVPRNDAGKGLEGLHAVLERPRHGGHLPRRQLLPGAVGRGRRRWPCARRQISMKRVT